MPVSPWVALGAFIAAAAVMLVCLADMERQGLEGTALGTLVMPFCSGAPNLIFAVVLAWRRGQGSDVVTNAFVNNVTNLSLLIALPCLLWGVSLVPRRGTNRKALRQARLDRLSICTTLMAVLFFTGATWALGRDGTLSTGDGLALVVLFAFWHTIELFHVLRTSIETDRRFGLRLAVAAVLLLLGAAAMFLAVDRLVDWVCTEGSGFLGPRYLGWLSGWLMVLPNAVPVLYYGARRRGEVVYASQVGDGHICIPLCIGIFAVVHPIALPPFFAQACALLAGMALLHLAMVALLGRLPRWVAVALLVLYGAFVRTGLGAA